MQVKSSELLSFMDKVISPLSVFTYNGCVGVYSCDEYRTNRDIPMAKMYFAFDIKRVNAKGKLKRTKVEIAYSGNDAVLVSVDGQAWVAFNDYERAINFDALFNYVRFGVLPIVDKFSL